MLKKTIWSKFNKIQFDSKENGLNLALKILQFFKRKKYSNRKTRKLNKRKDLL